MESKNWLIIGAVTSLLAVAFGAFGAHGIEEAIPEWYGETDLDIDEDELKIPVEIRLKDLHESKLKTWITGVRYHTSHGLALLALGILLTRISKPSPFYHWAGFCFLLGIIGFSGSIYLLVITKFSTLGMLAAVGGVFQLLGWLFLIIAILKTDFVAETKNG